MGRMALARASPGEEPAALRLFAPLSPLPSVALCRLGERQAIGWVCLGRSLPLPSANDLPALLLRHAGSPLKAEVSKPQGLCMAARSALRPMLPPRMVEMIEARKPQGIDCVLCECDPWLLRAAGLRL